jgi:hypothetical protein
LKSDKTAVTHIDEGFVFLGQRIVRRPKGPKRHVYTFVSDEALASARRKVKSLTGRSTTNLELSELIVGPTRKPRLISRRGARQGSSCRLHRSELPVERRLINDQ